MIAFANKKIILDATRRAENATFHDGVVSRHVLRHVGPSLVSIQTAIVIWVNEPEYLPSRYSPSEPEKEPRRTTVYKSRGCRNWQCTQVRLLNFSE